MVRARLRDVAMWFVTGFDDIVVERTWRRLRRGEGTRALEPWRDLATGFPGCAALLLAAVAGLALYLVFRHPARGSHGQADHAAPAVHLSQRPLPDR